MSIEIGPGGRQKYFDFKGGRITVRQYTISSGNTLTEPEVLWPSGESECDDVVDFCVALQLALPLWNEWKKDTGRKWQYNNPGSYEILPPSYEASDYIWE